jgi:TonB-linked SusC/RagA family outer membrane protein
MTYPLINHIFLQQEFNINFANESIMKNDFRLKCISRLFLTVCMLMISWTIFAQQSVVTGIVKDEKGDPVIGANIKLKGSDKSIGTITDMNGNFSLSNIKVGATLEVSFVGYVSKNVVVPTSKKIVVVLSEDSKALDEIVVVGYGVQRKSDLTGAVTSVNAKTIESHPQTSLIHSLEGTIPGLNIAITGTNAEGSSTTTRIRGDNSISADNKPLVILDGIPFDGPWSEINPNDVQSVEVLKDASSSAIYGARGSNGVILITSKRGDKGKLVVSFDANVTMDHPVNIPHVMNGEEFWKYKLEALEAANTTTPTADNPEPWMGSITTTEKRLHDAGTDTNWIDLCTQNGVRQQYNLSFRGGVNKTNYFVSFNYTDAKGTAVNDNFKRYNIRFNLDQEFTSWLKFSTTTQMGRYDRSGSSPSFVRAFLMNPLAEAYNSDGSIRTSAWEDSSEAFCVNPLNSLNNITSDIRSKVITNNVLEIKCPFVPGLSYKFNSGYTYDVSSWKQYQGLNTYYGARSNGILNTSDWHSSEWIIENILTYQNQFGKHRIFFTGLYSAQSKVYEENNMAGQGFPNDVMYYYQISKATTVSGSSSYYKQNHISQMARLNYTYDDRYLLTLTARRDGYSAFGENSKFGVFPSMALGWNITNEKFFQDTPLNRVISNLKYRISWGKNGNEAISAYATLPNLSTYNYLSDDHKPSYGFYPAKLASPSLSWETTSSFNMGLDFSLLKGRIQGTFDIYWSRTKDLLLSRSIPSINGTGTLISNIGKTKNNGFEFQLTSNNINLKDFNWSSTFNLSHYKTAIVDVGLYDANGKPMDDVGSYWFIGQPVSVNYDYRFISIWQIADKANPEGQQDPNYRYSVPGYMKYDDKDGVNDITTADKQIIGSRIPKVNMSLMNTFTYKDISLSIFLTAKLGQTARNYLLDVATNSYRQNRLMANFWTPENPINSYPKNSLDTSVNPMDAGFYQKTDYLRIQDVNLSYTFPAKLLKNIFLKRLQLYMNINNLHTWTKWGGLDPEFLSDQRATPAVRSITFGLKLDL